MAETKQVSVLITLELPDRFNTNSWPVQMVIKDDMVCGGMWGFLDAVIRMGLMEPGEGSHLVVLTFDDKDYPDWLPKTTLAGSWCSRIMMPILKHSLKRMTHDEGVHAVAGLRTSKAEPWGKQRACKSERQAGG